MHAKNDTTTLTKVVYFDEESVSDLLDIDAGGRQTTTSDSTNERAAELEASASAKAAAKFNWLPFFGGSADAGTTATASALGRSILSKTLSNTILTDYLAKLERLSGVETITDHKVLARKDSAAWMKMYTPYLAMMRSEELPVNLAAMDAALAAAKGYYELLAESDGEVRCILRFNLQAFRNNYGLVDLARMDLVFHGVRVGSALESTLTMQAEMSPNEIDVTATQIARGDIGVPSVDSLDVYDVLLAGVQYRA